MNQHSPFALRSLLLASVLLALCALPFAAHAQTATATLSGTVVDQNGAVVPDAAITVENIGTALKREATTNDEGYFTVPLLPPAIYSVTAQRAGFMVLRLEKVVLNVGDQKTLKIQLKTGDVKETVVVNGEAPLINESPAVGTIVDRQFVANMPLNGRSFQSLILLTPGIVPTAAAANNTGEFSVNGQRATSNYFMVDGVSANIGIEGGGGSLGNTAGGSGQGATAVGGYSNLVSVDAVQEFKIQTSTYAPEFGRTPGGQFEFVTRSGTNQFHGSAFDYLRNDKLDANNWFSNSKGLPRAAERQNDFGGVFGGPLYLPRFGEGGRRVYNGKNRTFFFFSYEGLRLRLPKSVIYEVPTLATRQNSTAFFRPFLNAFPIPNGPNLADGLALFSGTYSDPAKVDATSIRIDHAISSRLTLFGRYNNSPSALIARATGVTSPNLRNSSFVHTQTLTLSGTQTFGKGTANDIRFNYSRNAAGLSQALDDFGGAVPITPSSVFPSPVTDSTAMGFTLNSGTFASWSAASQGSIQRQMNLVDTLSVTVGPHQIKAGVDYRRLAPSYRPPSYQVLQSVTAANLTGSTISSLRVISQPTTVDYLFHNLSLFAQDTWRVASRLSVTYGLRWELVPPPSFPHGGGPIVALGFDNPATVSIAPLGTQLYHTTYNNFAPRVGLAYQLRQNTNHVTVVRGGFGVFYDLGTTPTGYILQQLPFLITRSASNAAVPFTSAALAPPALITTPPYSNFSAFDPNIKLPYTLEWNVAVEQQLGSNEIVTASYVGAAGRRLLQGIQYPAPNANFTGTVTFTGNLATSDYDALQLQYQRRLSRGIQALASYTWSHSIDDQSLDVFSSAQSLSRGNSSFDIRHRAAAAITFDIPGPKSNAVMRALFNGWGLDTIINVQSAAPVDLIGRSSVTIDGKTQSVRPNVVSGIPFYLYGSQYPGGKIINNTPNQGGTGCKGPFCPPPVGQQGNLGRNVVRAYPVSQVDVTLRRQFKLGERVKLQWRGDVFNILNHPNFGNPSGSIASSAFGVPTVMYGTSLGTGGQNGGLNPLYQIGGPRSLQLSLKLIF